MKTQSSSILSNPNKSHRKLILIPDKSEALAELFGIEFGDGGIGNGWQIVITLNSEADLKYSFFVRDLIFSLFGLTVRAWKRPNKKALLLISSSTSLVDFFVDNGAVRGNKVDQNFDIPDWIKGNPVFERAFVRGVVDTDGCFYTHKHFVGGKAYLNIGFCFASYSQNLLQSVASILEKNGIRPHIEVKRHRICLYSKEAQQKYMTVFGSSNPRIFEKYHLWRGVRVV